MERIEFRAMGCEMLALLDSEKPAASLAIATLPLWFAEWEQHLSRFRGDSELSMLNRSQGKWFSVSPVLWRAIDTALDAAAQSDGLVTPTMLDALKATGYDRSFEAIAHAGSTYTQAASTTTTLREQAPSWRDIERDPANHMVRLPQGMQLDLGGAAKGWAANRAVLQLSMCGPALVDAGGDIAISGPLADGSAWSIGIADPRRPDQDLATLLVERGGVATSGRDYRRWLRDGVWQHHILDPRTGSPANTDVLSATVVAPTVCEAEIAAKVVVILGSHAGMGWLEARPALAGLIVLEDGQVLRSERLQREITA